MVLRCHDMEGVARFSSRAEVYARARPSYPEAMIDALLASAGARPGAVIIDLGAGTGISTRLLARVHGRAFGLDPNLSMLDAGPRLASAPLAAGRAELLPLRNATAHVITAFNAFHWFQPEPFFDEAHRVIAPSGSLALVWNDWNLEDPFTAEFVRLMRSCAGDFPREDREAEVAPLYQTCLFTGIRRSAWPNIHTLDRETLPMRLQSMSYVPREGPVWDDLAFRLDALFEKYASGDGTVRHHYTTAVFVAQRA